MVVLAGCDVRCCACVLCVLCVCGAWWSIMRESKKATWLAPKGKREVRTYLTYRNISK